jgi:hypothetical protein
MELLLLENEQLKERLRIMQAAEERAKATIAVIPFLHFVISLLTFVGVHL